MCEEKETITLDRKGVLAPRVGFLISLLERVRNRTIRVLDSLPNEEIDFTPDVENIETVGPLLLHIAAVEWSWIFEDIDGEEMDYEKWKWAFPLREGWWQLWEN